MPDLNVGECRSCRHAIRFAPLGPTPKRSDWIDEHGVLCRESADRRHFPVTPIEGIDY